MKKKTSRHGKNARDQIKLSCKVDFETWARVGRAAGEMDRSEYLRREIMELVQDIELTMEDYKKIDQIKKNRKDREG